MTGLPTEPRGPNGYDAVRKHGIDLLSPTEPVIARLPVGHLLDQAGKPVPFHIGQEWMYEAVSRYVIMSSGSQGGKTASAPLWLAREIYGNGAFGAVPAREVTDRGRGRGDYLAVAPTYDLFKLKMLPSILNIFEDKLGVGRFWNGDSILELRDPETGKFLGRRSNDPKMWGRVILRSANATGGLESSTAKGAWLDEAGQGEFGIAAWRAVQRRVALNRGRILITTTLYDFGWVEEEFVDPLQEKTEGVERETVTVGAAEATRIVDPKSDVTLIQFDSIVNPEYPDEEYQRAKATMPEDEFNRQYRGRKVTPRTMIYDVFDPTYNTCPRFPIPAGWPRYIGLDFGGVHMAAVRIAEDTASGKLYVYQEYLQGGLTIHEHIAHLLGQEPGMPMTVGGAKSEGQWRNEFSFNGLPVGLPAASEVEVGIARVYAQFKLKKLVIFDDLAGLLKDIKTYRRKRDATGNILAEIENKAQFHYADSLRYIISTLRDDLTWVRGMGA